MKTLLTLVAAAGLPIAGAAGSGAARPEPPAFPDVERVYYDSVLPDGSLTGGVLLLPRARFDPRARVESPVVTLWDPGGARGGGPGDGPGPDRIDLVIVGDGYQSGQLALYAAHAQSAANAMLSQQPFAAYRTFFRVHRVDVVSPDSGVDHDPTFGIYRDTALNMGFWCNDIERLLCVDVGRAYQHANAAPQGVDQVLAIANSTKYGGAGYPSSELATVAGGNSAASEVAIHEFGHSLGDLADEYDYGGGTRWTGAEVPEPNASIYTATQMTGLSRKWFRWVGVNDPAWDGLVSSFEGCRYYPLGLFRPTNNSKMRSLGRPFNPPSAEALIAEFYRVVRPIDDSTPVTQALTGTETVFVDPVDPVGNPLAVQWHVDGRPVPGATGHTIDLRALSLTPGFHTLMVRVADNTPWVRDPAIRSSRLTQTRNWVINVTAQPCYPDCDTSTGPRVLDAFDFLCFQNRYAAQDPYACGCDTTTGPGACDVFDFLCFQNAYVAGCP